jgi:hypothetical protein
MARPRDLARPDEIRVALERFERAFRQAVVGKFDSRAETAAEPFDKLLLHAGSELAKFWHETQPVVAAARRAINGECVHCRSLFDENYLAERLPVLNTLLRLKREQQRRN